MLVLLEGCDGTGKTTLADALEAQIKRDHPDDVVVRLHSGPLKGDPVDEYVFSIQDYRPGTGVHIIADRWHYGEMVYGPLYRGKSAIGEEQWRWIELWLESRGASTWVVTNTLDEVERRLRERGEDFLQPEHVAHVLSAFENDFQYELTFAALVSVGDGIDLDVTVAGILELARMDEESAAETLAVSTSYVGALYPDVLLVGDKRGGKEPFPTEGAFYPVNGNSATYLLRSLPGISWQGVAFVNANEETDLKGLIDVLWGGGFNDPEVVALGAEAAKTLAKQVPELKFGRVPHPQYVRRFHNARVNEYGILTLETAMNQEDHSKWPN